MATVCMLLACTIIQLATASLVNVALHKPASMSSSWPGYRASEAVDGDTYAGTWGGSTIIDTDNGYPFAWWKVDLRTEVLDATVRIYFRTDYTWRRKGVKLYTSTSPFPELNPTRQGQLCHTVTGSASGSNIPDVYNVTCPGRWRYLLLYTDTDNDGHGAVLDFGEIEILGMTELPLWGENEGYLVTELAYNDNAAFQNAVRVTSPVATLTSVCVSGSYGPGCSLSCSARECSDDSSPCDHVTGQCVGGCKPGYRGTDCGQKCESDSYGPNCSLSCSARECSDDSSPCDHVTGQCVGGCKPGYGGLDCRYQCESGSYGPGCSLSCSARECSDDSSPCDHVTGQCLGICKPRYGGFDCRFQCESDSYGLACNLSCSARECSDDSSPCDHVTGQCVGGCKPGYGDLDCRNQCITGNYGLNCSKSCINRHCVTSSYECDHHSGQCPDGCKLGWRGLDCTSPCPAGTFGSDCTSCSTRHCQGESDCPADGTCSQGCQDGWTGNICTRVCSDGTYGPNCTEKCGECDGVCDSTNGRCPAGCLDGYDGTKCDVAPEAASTGADTVEPVYFGVVTLVGAVVGTFLVVVLLCVGIIICLIRQGRLQWIKRAKDRRRAQESRDFTQMSNITSSPAGESEHAQSTDNVGTNDYAVLDLYTIRGNKDYDVIQPKHDRNL